MKLLKSSLAATLLLSSAAGRAELTAHFGMEVTNGNVTESVSGRQFPVEGNFSPENVAGAVGEALRFDGYTSRIKAQLGDVIPGGSKAMTFSLWTAVPSYPVIQLDTDTREKTAIASCLDDNAKTGFGFFLGFNGQYSFKTYIGGWPVEVEADAPLATYQWNHLVAVVDCEAKATKLYCNGVEVASGKASGELSFAGGAFYMGQGTASRMMGPFELMSFNGLIDDVCIWNEALPLSRIQSFAAENEPDLNIPASRFASQQLRPRFHGMPAAGWTNECHGMWQSDGRYHLFFQKNADGPYMARLHWGHISSANLYDWREERIAIAPGEWYDIKGCWSGCVFADEEITGSLPNAIYTAVDYAKAMIAQAAPESPALDLWTKSASNPIIGGRPSGLSDDFRDPYFFRSGSNAYIIVGGSKDNTGACTLHRYNPTSKTWSNSGDIFFQGTNRATDGRFWEMPNATPMPDGRWLFTATPLETSQGVRTLYWTGSIAADGKFLPDADSKAPRLVEMNSKQGFGLLSPTIFRQGDKTIALGIVPDKLPAGENWKLGWAHCYSLPREWNLAADGSLIQTPAESLKGMRSEIMYAKADFTIGSLVEMSPVEGRMAELCGEFEVGASAFGFSIFRGAGAEARIYYNPASGEVVADFSALPRLVNDAGVYDGVYRCSLPERPAPGETLKLNVFIDHSIIDIFAGDRWATSIRVFPTSTDATGIAAFAEGPVKAKSLCGWVLDPQSEGSVGELAGSPSDFRTAYRLDGIAADAGTSSGIYICEGKKHIRH